MDELLICRGRASPKPDCQAALPLTATHRCILVGPILSFPALLCPLARRLPRSDVFPPEEPNSRMVPALAACVTRRRCQCPPASLRRSADDATFRHYLHKWNAKTLPHAPFVVSYSRAQCTSREALMMAGARLDATLPIGTNRRRPTGAPIDDVPMSALPSRVHGDPRSY